MSSPTHPVQTQNTVFLGMNPEQLKSIVWKLVAAVGGAMVTFGIVKADELQMILTKWEPIIGAALTLFTVYWSIRQNTVSGLARATVNALPPAVDKIAIDDKKVVAEIKANNPDTPVVATTNAK